VIVGCVCRPNSESRGCFMPCLDDGTKACGCADSLCPDPTPRGQEHNRQWAVYEIVAPRGGKSGGKKAGGKKGAK
jgi:hypothetical protein